MILDYFDMINMTPQEWEEICDSCYSIRFKGQWHKVPAQYMGDCGIEGFVDNGIVYQCYYPEKEYTDNELYEHQRDKLSKDVAKLISEDNINKLQNVLGRVNIKEWQLVVPIYKDRRIIEHANKKEREIIFEIKSNPSKYFHLDDNIRITVMQASCFQEEIPKVIRGINNKVKLRIDSTDEIDYSSCDVDKVSNIKRKLKAIQPNIADENLNKSVNMFIKFYLDGVAKINKLRVDLPHEFKELHELKEAYKADVEMKTNLNADHSLNNTIFKEITDDFGLKLEKLELFDVATIQNLKNEIVAGWLADCSMEFII